MTHNAYLVGNLFILSEICFWVVLRFSGSRRIIRYLTEKEPLYHIFFPCFVKWCDSGVSYTVQFLCTFNHCFHVDIGVFFPPIQ